MRCPSCFITTLLYIITSIAHTSEAIIEVYSKINPSISGLYVRGVEQGHEQAFVKALTYDKETAEQASLDDVSLYWLYKLDMGLDGYRWLIGHDVTSFSGFAYVDSWSSSDPCRESNKYWLVSAEGEWTLDREFSIVCHGLEKGGIDACSVNDGAIPCIDLKTTVPGGGDVQMPVLMLGTAYIGPFHGAGASNPEVVELPPAIEMALDKNYQGLDLGSQLHPAYANEKAVGKMLAARPGKRQRVFLTTKLSPSEHGFKSALHAFQRSLRLLRTDTIDLFLIHHPHCLMAESCDGEWTESWRALERLLDLGAARAIGVSNFDYDLLRVLLGDDPHRPSGFARAPVALVQNRADPLAPENPKVLALCQAHNVTYQAFSVLGRQWVVGPWSQYWRKEHPHPILEHPEIVAIANRLSQELRQVLSPAQVVLRWALQMGWTVVPKTANEERLETNRRVFHFQLTERDMGIINNLRPPFGDEL